MKTKILIVSNEPFSDTGSNGRTIKNFLLNIPKRDLAQFYLHGTPDREFCDNYFCVSDRDALNAFLWRKTQVQAKPASVAVRSVLAEKPRRSYRNLVLRNIVWQSMLWWKKGFDTFLNAFKPDIVLLQAGDAPFMYKIALKIARRYNAKLMMYNSEHYVLKKRMYASVDRNPFWHDCLMRSLKAQYRRFMKRADFCIYNTEALERAYQEVYPHQGKSCVLYTTSEMSPLPDESEGTFRLLYCGNLGVGRERPLNELAKALHEVDGTAKLDIYGKFVSEKSQKLICANPNVVYHGFVDYSEIPDIMSKASILVHCENNDRLENLRYAFSTKIADSLASTRPFLVYASREYPFVQYLKNNACAHIADTEEELKEVLIRCKEMAYRNKYAEKAKWIADKNHSKTVNCQKIQGIMDSLFDCDKGR